MKGLKIVGFVLGGIIVLLAIGVALALTPSVQTWDELSDDELLAEMVRIHASRRQVDDAVAQVVRRLRARRVTWARIGEILGMTRQSAWERFSGED